MSHLTHSHMPDKGPLVRTISATPEGATTPPHPKPSSPPPARSTSRLARWRGWRVSVTAGAILSFAVLVLNVVLLAWSLNQPYRSSKDEPGTATVFRGDCKRAAAAFKWSHLAINLMGTLLLSASTVGEQVVSAPTRKEVDRAHEVGKWMHIGVFGYRNWKWIANWRRVVWVALMASSVPLHLVYNSVVFPEFAANDYRVHFVSESFVTGASGNTYVNNLRASIVNRTQFSNSECIDALNVDFVSSYRDVLLVLDCRNDTEPIAGDYAVYGEEEGGGIYLICNDSDFCDLNYRMLFSAENWKVYFYNTELSSEGVKVKYCLVEKTDAQCTVVVGTWLLAVVILCNAIKLGSLAYLTTRARRSYSPFITVGDAIASFLTVEDAYTKEEGVLSRADIFRWSEKRSQDSMESPPASVRPWRSELQLWFRSASSERWLTCIILCSFVVIIGFTLLIIGHSSLTSGDVPNKYKYWRSLGFGVALKTSEGRLVASTTGKSVVENVFLVNLPQLVVSIIYVLYNAVVTSNLLTAEYGIYSTRRQALRVSEPYGDQRSTYWLSLPYFYAIPIMIAMGTLHWLISQSIFLVRLRVIAYIKEDSGKSYIISGCGWSPLALFWSCIVGLVLTLALFFNGFRRLGKDIPIMSSCSAAISAASHRSVTEDEDMVRLALMYGVIGDNGDGTKRVGFSAEEVEPLISGDLYR